MKKSKKKLPLFLMMAAIGLFIAASVATARDQFIQGDYAFTGEVTCISSPVGFNADLTPIPPVSMSSFSIHGIYTFNDDGTGMLKGRMVNTGLTSPFGANSIEAEHPFTYIINTDNTISLSSPAFLLILTGKGAGLTFTVDNIELKGMISNDKKSIILSSDEPRIEKTTYTNGYANGYVTYGICHRSHILFRMNK